MMFASPKKLRQAGILGMNMRNVSYIAGHNPRRLYPRVDDKLQTKLLAEKSGINVPNLIGTVHYQADIKTVQKTLSEHPQFVIKPAHGSAGKGILVIQEHDGENYQKPSGQTIRFSDIDRHLSNTLSGLYSLGGRPDVAMIETMVDFSDTFENYTFEGVPDIRVILLHGYPVMAMTRLSTSASDGKANLHQGAVGVGLDLGSGKALSAVQHGHPVTVHPDTGQPFDQLHIPQWDILLELAASCYEITELGYLGADIVLDRNLGPLVLELNARPGLAIQVANGTGLAPRLKLIEEQLHAGMERSPAERVIFCVNHFGRKEVA